jgi:hypothetical protein
MRLTLKSDSVTIKTQIDVFKLHRFLYCTHLTFSEYIFKSVQNIYNHPVYERVTFWLTYKTVHPHNSLLLLLISHQMLS